MRLGKNHYPTDRENQCQHHENVLLVRLHQIVPEESDPDLRHHDDEQQTHNNTGSRVRVLSANAPLTLFTANQPIPAVRDIRPAGSVLPQ